jgi:hypothetical protein
MPTIKAGLDAETYEALVHDAERHLRPTDRHIAALLRAALGLPVPLPARPLPETDIWPAEGSGEPVPCPHA